MITDQRFVFKSVIYSDLMANRLQIVNVSHHVCLSSELSRRLLEPDLCETLITDRHSQSQPSSWKAQQPASIIIPLLQKSWRSIQSNRGKMFESIKLQLLSAHLCREPTLANFKTWGQNLRIFIEVISTDRWNWMTTLLFLNSLSLL